MVWALGFGGLDAELLGFGHLRIGFFGKLAVAQDTATQEKPTAKQEETDDYKGLEAFEEASRIRVTEGSKEGLGKVIELCKKALELGLEHRARSKKSPELGFRKTEPRE
jgi:hypothetical protein